MYEGEERHMSAHAMAPSKTCAKLGMQSPEKKETLRRQKVCDTTKNQ